MARGQQSGVEVVVDTSFAPDNQGYAAAVVVVGEDSYTHGTYWDKEEPFLPAQERGLINHLQSQNIPIVLVYIMPRPYIIEAEANQANAIVVAYRPGGGGGPAVARLLFGDIKTQGKLPFQLPRNMAQVGNDQYPESGELWDIPYDMGATAAERQPQRGDPGEELGRADHGQRRRGLPVLGYSGADPAGRGRGERARQRPGPGDLEQRG